MKRVILSFLLFLIFQVNTTFAQEKEPFKFYFTEIPFGKPMKEVLKLIEGAEVEEDKKVTAHFTRDYDVMKTYFSKGVNSYTCDSYFESKLVKKYIAEYGGWGKMSKIHLYFVRSNVSNKDYTLFLVRKFFKKSSDDYKIIFNGFKQSISKKIGVPILSQKAYFKSCYWTFSGREYITEEALFSCWDTKYTRVFLLVPDYNLYGISPQIIYLSNSGWKKYERAWAEYRREKAEENTIDDF